MVYSYVKITNIDLNNEVLNYFIKILNPRDKRNKHKLKVGKIKFDDDTVEVYIYGSPKRIDIDYWSDVEKTITFDKGTELGSFRICWMVNYGTYKYIVPSHGFDATDCFDFDKPSLTETKDKALPRFDNYDSMKSSILKYVNEQKKILPDISQCNK